MLASGGDARHGDMFPRWGRYSLHDGMLPVGHCLYLNKPALAAGRPCIAWENSGMAYPADCSGPPGPHAWNTLPFNDITPHWQWPSPVKSPWSDSGTASLALLLSAPNNGKLIIAKGLGGLKAGTDLPNGRIHPNTHRYGQSQVWPSSSARSTMAPIWRAPGGKKMESSSFPWMHSLWMVTSLTPSVWMAGHSTFPEVIYGPASSGVVASRHQPAKVKPLVHQTGAPPPGREHFSYDSNGL